MRALVLKSCVLLALAFGSTGAWTASLVGEVIAVAEGDTLTVLDGENHQHTVRLAGIDAPEKRQPLWTKSRDALADTLLRKQVTVDYAKLDRYGRLVGKVAVAGLDAGLRQIELGMAWHYVFFAKEQSPADQAAYSAAEAQAREARSGLWAELDPITPWDYRRAVEVFRAAEVHDPEFRLVRRDRR